jgi:hypothetical protein
MALEFKAKLCLAWRWSSKRSFVWPGVGVQSEALFGMAVEFKAKLCLAEQHGVGVQSEALFGRARTPTCSLCLAMQSFALNSNVPTMRYFKNNKLNPYFKE